MSNSTKDINEVQAIIDRLLYLIREAKGCFTSARNWGFLDILGGGVITDLIKHYKINSARGIMNEISYNLKELHREMKDLTIPDDMQMEMGGFSTFADFVFDGFLADAWMQSKIFSSLDQLEQLENRILDLDRRIKYLS